MGYNHEERDPLVNRYGSKGVIGSIDLTKDGKFKESIELIGAHIQIYGHFGCYIIPYDNEKSINNESDVTIEQFLELVHEYYYTDRLNKGYSDNVKESNQTKKFLISKVSNSSYEIGLEWIESNKFKED